MLTRIVLALSLLVAAPLAAQPAAPAEQLVRVTLDTDLGRIVLELDQGRAPVTTANFLKYVEGKRFDGQTFYRALKMGEGGLIQGGVRSDARKLLPPIAHEPTSETGVRHLAGALSMARNEPGSATGDFSIMLSPQPFLDADPASEDAERRAGYAAFGHVVEGMDVVRAIFDAPLDPEKGEGAMKGQMLAQPVRIVSVRRISAP